MQKSKWLYSFVALLVVFISFSSLTGDYETEEDLIKAANKHFSKGEYTQCIELFTQLISNHPENPEYNYKYGTCLLFCSEDKGEAVKYLKFATSKSSVEGEAFFYYGRALQLTYQFEPAKVQFQKFKASVKPKVSKKYETNSYIKQCATAQKMIGDIQQINVVSKKKVRKDEFFRSYRLGSMKRNILVTPPEFQSKADKKGDSYSLIVHNPMNEVIYISSRNDKEGMGGKDIFKIQKMPDGTFSEPINVGPSVNTSLDEDYPYLHPNGRVLYFASKGHGGLGGYDIYRSELDTLLNLWGPATNLGFAVNSPDDDIMYISDMDENIAYFASSRDNKQGDITVYKILPNTKTDPIIIVQGEVEVKGSTQNKAEISVYDETGEEIGVYTSQQLSGVFTMALEEDQVYTIGVSAPGKGEKKVSLQLPKKSVKDMIAKKFVIENDDVKLVDNTEAIKGGASKEKILAQIASLNVNQVKDVDFNTKVVKKEPKPKVNKEVVEEETPVDEEPEVNPESESADLVADAKQEVEDIKGEKEKLKKEIDATYFVAQKKKIKSNLIKDEIEELSTNLNDTYQQEEKDKIKAELDQKEIDLKVAAAQATSALERAGRKEKELTIKDKQIESANAYLSAVEKAENSNNSLKSIQDLETARDNLDKIENEIQQLKADDGSAEKHAKTDAARKNVADKEVAHDLIVSDLKDIDTERKNLEEQIDNSKNKGLKEELNLQIKELNEEEKQKKVEERISKSQLTEAKSQLAVLESSDDISNEISNEIADGSLAPISEEQKANIQKDVEETVSILDQEEREKKRIEEKELAKEKVNTVENAKEELVKIDEEGKVSPKQQYDDEIKKAEIRKEELTSIRDEKELLEISLANTEGSRQKKSIQEKIDQLNQDEELAISDIKTYVETAKEKGNTLPESDKAESENRTEDLNSLAVEIEKIEEDKAESVRESLVTTEEITIDLETATDDEINNIVANETKIKTYEVSEVDESEETTQLRDKSKEKRKEALALLTEQNKAQIELEKNGESSSESVLALEEKAYESLFKAAELEGEANANEFELKRKSTVEEVFSSEDISTPALKQKAKEVNQTWENASDRRKAANQAKDKKEKVRLVNEAGELEQSSLKALSELQNDISKRKEELAKLESEVEVVDPSVENEIAVVDPEVGKVIEPENNVQESDNPLTSPEDIKEEIVEEPKITEEEVVKEEEVITVQNTENPIGQSSKEVQSANEIVTYKDYNPNKPTKKAIVSANKEGYGIERNEEFVYGPSPKAKAELEGAKTLENQAAQKYFEAQKLSAQAEASPENAKKLNKQAKKLLKEGNKIQDSANEKYKNVNAAEHNYNDEEILFAIENDDVVKKDSARIILNESKKEFNDAQELRKLASKEKDKAKRNELVNQAYNMELDAISKQNYVLSGELDGEEESDLIVQEFTPVKREENDYTRKAKALRIQADLETDDTKKNQLFEEARMNDLAGNTKRTKRMQESLVADKISYENNSNILITSREQSNNNTPANKAYAMEKEADSLYNLAKELTAKAENNSDQIQRIVQIEEAKDLMQEASEVQTASIRKYQESKSAPDEPDFIAVFRTDSVKENLPTVQENQVVQVVSKEVEPNQAEEEEIQEEVVENEPEIIEEPEKVIFSDTKVNNQVNNSLPEEVAELPEVINEIEEDQTETINNQTEDNLTEDEKIEASYVDLTSKAKEIEMQEVARVEKIELLKSQSTKNKEKSEELLSTVDAMEDETEILATIAKANEFRDKAEKQEVDAKNEEIILKNNIAEGEAMRKEAELILGAADDNKQKEILANSENSSPELKKINEFLNKEEEAVPVEPIFSDTKVNNQVNNVVQTEVIDENEVDENQNNETVLNTETVNLPKDATLLPVGSTEDQIMNDEFVMNSSKVYTSADEIPIDAGMPDGLIYQVQVGAFRNKIDPAIFNGLSPLVGEQTPSGIIRYKVGYFRGFKSANMAKGRIRNIGYRDAFVVVFMNGKRISMDQADQVIEEADDSEKFVYENLVADEVSKLKQLGIREEEGDEDPTDVSASPVVVDPVNTNTSRDVNSSSPSIVAQENGLSNDLLKVGGVFYTVQVGVFRSPRVTSDLKGVGPLMTEKLNNGLLRYTTGVYRDFNSANQRKQSVRDQGIKDAFVIAYNGTQKITASAARELEGSSSTAGNTENSNELGSDNSTDKVVFMVQVGAYRTPITPSNTPVFRELTSYPISNIETSSGLLIYMVGKYDTKAEADNLRQTVIAAGGSDCFVVALQNGKRIPMRTALSIVR